MKSQSTFFISDACIGDIFNFSVSSFDVSKEVTNLLTRIHKGWIRFVEEPASYKKLFVVGRERGWVERSGEKKKDGDHYDVKQFFHFHHDLRKRLDAKGIKYQKYNTLITDLEKLHALCVKVSLEIAERIDQRLLGKGLVTKVKRAMKDHVIRLLYYPDRLLSSLEEENQDGLAKAHFDRCLWTIALFENLPGLRLGLNLEDSHEYQRNKALFFSSAKLDNLTTKNIKMVRHGVVNERRGPRVSVIFFAHIPLSEEITVAYIRKRETELGLRKSG